jgi:hypothetical protein
MLDSTDNPYFGFMALRLVEDEIAKAVEKRVGTRFLESKLQ